MTAHLTKSMYLTLRSAFIVALFVFVFSCDDDDKPSQQIANENNKHVNDWILDKMEFWYLWSNELPAAADKNLNPDDFFQFRY